MTDTERLVAAADRIANAGGCYNPAQIFESWCFAGIPHFLRLVECAKPRGSVSLVGFLDALQARCPNVPNPKAKS